MVRFWEILSTLWASHLRVYLWSSCLGWPPPSTLFHSIWMVRGVFFSFLFFSFFSFLFFSSSFLFFFFSFLLFFFFFSFLFLVLNADFISSLVQLWRYQGCQPSAFTWNLEWRAWIWLLRRCLSTVFVDWSWDTNPMLHLWTTTYCEVSLFLGFSRALRWVQDDDATKNGRSGWKKKSNWVVQFFSLTQCTCLLFF